MLIFNRKNLSDVIYSLLGSENCLYVCVYTPKLDSNALLPVVVFIHGGVFMFGAGSEYDVSYLMDRDMIYVGINYRLGPLGEIYFF